MAGQGSREEEESVGHKAGGASGLHRRLPDLRAAALAILVILIVGLPCLAGSPFAWVNKMFAEWLPKGTPPTVQPTPRKDQWWREQHDQLVERARAGTTGLAFFGDSITQGMDYAADTIMELWGKHHPNNFGIGGDTVQNLLWRLQNGELDGLKPKVAVVLIGTNNLSSDTDEDIAAGVKADAYELRRRCPKTRVVVLGILPRGQHASDKYRERIKQINQQLATVQDNRHIFFVDIGQSLLQPDGSISPEVMPDFLHPNAQGYKLMFHALKPHIDPLLEDKADQRRKTSSNSSRERLSTSSPPPRE